MDSRDRTRPASRRPSIFDALFVIALAGAFVPTWLTVHDLAWPHDPDLYRDIAQAQTILDGDLLGDAHYRGETIWYNPLVPAIVALLSWITAMPIVELYTRAGPFLNLATPIGFYIMVSALFGRRVGWLAALFFLFLGPASEPDWAWATYSPWLFTANLAPAFFYPTLLLAYCSRRASHAAWRVALGAMLGVTFLAHTAPAVLLGCLLVLDSVWRLTWRDGDPRSPRTGTKAIRDLLLVLSIAFLVAQPFALSILWNYGLQVANPAGLQWTYVGLSNALSHIGSSWVFTPVTPFALVGLYAAWGRRRDDASSIALLAWAAVAAAFIAYGFVVQGSHQLGFQLPVIVPAFHFTRSLHGAAAVFAGLGVVRLLEFLTERLRNRSFRILESPIPSVVLAGSLLLLLGYPRYMKRHDFTVARAQVAVLDDPRPLVSWIRENTDSSDTFLAPDRLGLYVVGPAGRKVGAVSWDAFSNPYVPWEQRYQDEATMVEALESGDSQRLNALARRYGITHIILRRDARVHPRLRQQLEVRRIDQQTQILRLVSVGDG